MPRAVASTLLLVLLVPLGLPAAATLGHDVPACCRANGTHYCTAFVRPAAGGQPAVQAQERCPHAHSVVLPHAAQQAQTRSEIPLAEETHPFLQEFVPGIHFVDSDDSHSERGPPLASR